MTWLKYLLPHRVLALVLLLVFGSIAISDRTPSGVGDVLQVTLPLTGLGCAIASGQGLRYTGRYFLMTITYNLSKDGLGRAPINERPNGGYRGFPSGHTTAATYGAVGMVQTCLAGNPAAQGVAILAAGTVGGSRIDVGAHDLWQVVAGGVWGWFFQIAALRGFDAWFRRAWYASGRGIAAGARWGLDAMSSLGRAVSRLIRPR